MQKHIHKENIQANPHILYFFLTLCSDTLLNVFLAIAVDNLANAQELTKVRYSPMLLNSLSLFFLSIQKN